MKSYEPNRPRPAIALVAATLTAITMGILVVAPAAFDSSQEAVRMLKVAKSRQAAPIAVAITPAQINVVGVREPEVASALPERPVITPLATR